MMISTPIVPAEHARLLTLNNEHAEELSLLDPTTLGKLAAEAFFARSIEGQAFIFAFDEHADYASPNFAWFRKRYRRFIYVDRVVVAASARGKGHARQLYDELFAVARDASHERIVCEVNIRPPNAASDAFHERLGFREVGRAESRHGRKLVRYLERII